MSSFSVARLSRCSRPFRSAQQANCPAHIGCNKIFLDLPVHTPPSNQSKNYNSRSNPSLERPTPRCAGGGMGIPPTPDSLTAPVSRQKRPERNATNEIEIKQKRRIINEPNRCPAAHNGLVAGSSPAGPTSLRSRELSEGCRAEALGEGGPWPRATAGRPDEISSYWISFRTTAPEMPPFVHASPYLGSG
jgi:hypothetical protein